MTNSKMSFGILTPVLNRRPGFHADWEPHAGIEEVGRIAKAAEQLGYEYLTACEHVAVPRALQMVIPNVRSGHTYWDPLSTFGYLSAHTSRIRLATLVLVIPHHHPLEIAKRYGTLDRICGGRLILGLGVGYNEREFRLLGTPFDDRGDRSDDAIRALRASFGRNEPVYHGRYYDFEDFIVDPCGVQEHVPIWIGGGSRRSLRRAVELGDAWAPMPMPLEQLSDWLGRARETEAWERRAQPLELALTLAKALDPIGAPAEAMAAVRPLREIGADRLQVRLIHDSLDHYIEQLAAMMELVDDV